MSEDVLSAAALQQQLQECEARLRHTPDAVESALLHRDAAYAAMDLGDFPHAMTHAVTGLDIARSTRNLSLQAKAHITVALVMAGVYDDKGADEHLKVAERLARQAGDARGLAVAAVTASHNAMERENYIEATLHLHGLLRSPHAAGLLDEEPQVGPKLQQAFHINYVKSAAHALHSAGRASQSSPASPAAFSAPDLTDTPADHLRPIQSEVAQQLESSVEFLHSLRQGERAIAAPRLLTDLLEALSIHAAFHGDWSQAHAFADERVRLAEEGQIGVVLGRALHSRAGLFMQRRDDLAVIRDASRAAQLYTEAGQELRAVDAGQLIADSLARQGRHAEAFKVQRDLMRRAEAMYRAYFQQSAQLRLIEHQAQAAEERAATFAQAALQDPLTGIPNRAAAMQSLDDLHEQARHGREAAIALLDVDHFKNVNDRYGHAAGDTVLKTVAQTIRETIRSSDSVARIGGEEFLLLFPGLRPHEAQQVCERINVRLAKLPWPDLAPDLRITSSIGVARVQADRSPNDTLHHADQAMYAAKRAGRHSVQMAQCAYVT